MSLWWIFVAATVIMVLISPYIYTVWVGRDIACSIELSTSIACAVYVTTINWCSIYTSFLNGIGKIKLQLYNAVILMLVYIPVSIFAGKIFGITGILVSLCAVSLPGVIWEPIQFNRLIQGTAKGIWNK